MGRPGRTVDHAALEAENRRREEQWRIEALNEKLERESYLRIAEQARQANLWIFDPLDKSWWNPDELEATFKWYITGHEKIMARVILKDPLETLKAGHKKLEEFAERVLIYERNKKVTLDKNKKGRL